MNAADQNGPKRRVDGPVTLDSRHRRKGRGADRHVEMALATFAEARVAAMALRVVHNLKVRRVKGGGQPLMHGPRNAANAFVIQKSHHSPFNLTPTSLNSGIRVEKMCPGGMRRDQT